jgi:hypothetical protein
MVLANNIKSNIMKTGSEEVNRKDKDRIQWQLPYEWCRNFEIITAGNSVAADCWLKIFVFVTHSDTYKIRTPICIRYFPTFVSKARWKLELEFHEQIHTISSSSSSLFNDAFFSNSDYIASISNQSWFVFHLAAKQVKRGWETWLNFADEHLSCS